ncbi:MAG: multiheme c-type cytochrome [Nitrospirota bacterium]
MPYRVIIIFMMSLFLITTASAQECVDCHKKVNPHIVSDWQVSKHSQAGINCSVCHGGQHKSDQDVEKVQIPTPDTCATCHVTQVQQFKSGKHALGWASMKAMPTAHWQPMALMEGMKGCGGCHKEKESE